MDGILFIMEGSPFVEILVTPMDGSLVILEHNLLSIFLLLQRMEAFSLRKVVFCRDLSYSIGW